MAPRAALRATEAWFQRPAVEHGLALEGVGKPAGAPVPHRGTRDPSAHRDLAGVQPLFGKAQGLGHGLPVMHGDPLYAAERIRTSTLFRAIRSERIVSASSTTAAGSTNLPPGAKS